MSTKSLNIMVVGICSLTQMVTATIQPFEIQENKNIQPLKIYSKQIHERDFHRNHLRNWQKLILQKGNNKKVEFKSFNRKFKISGVGIEKDVKEGSFQAIHSLNSWLDFYGQVSSKKGCNYSSYQGSLGFNTHF